MTEHSPAQDAAALVEAYYEKGFSDGLPVLPPSAQAVEAMLAAGGLKAQDVVGEIPVRCCVIHAEKVAINAVMAGCRPEYMPVVVSAVKGLCHPDFGYHGVATSTGGASIAIIVNGPIARQLDINATDNAFGPGNRANMTIGRALRLIMMNVVNTRPGKLDRSTLGGPGKIALCFAENEAGSPWEALHVERGFGAEESTTTLFAADGVMQIFNQLAATPEPLLVGIGDAMANLGMVNIVGQQEMVVVLAGEHTKILKSWSKQKIKEFLYANAKRSIAQLKKAGKLPGQPEAGDENTYRHPVKTPENILVVHAGGAAGNFSAVLPGWGSLAVTRSLTTPVTIP